MSKSKKNNNRPMPSRVVFVDMASTVYYSALNEIVAKINNKKPLTTTDKIASHLIAALDQHKEMVTLSR